MNTREAMQCVMGMFSNTLDFDHFGWTGGKQPMKQDQLQESNHDMETDFDNKSSMLCFIMGQRGVQGVGHRQGGWWVVRQICRLISNMSYAIMGAGGVVRICLH